MKKKELRLKLIRERLELAEEEVEELSGKAHKNLFQLREFEQVRSLILYFGIKNEVKTGGIFRKSKDLGKRIYFPRIVGRGLEFRRVKNLSELKPGRFSIPAPGSTSEEIGVEDADLLVLPGVAFDRTGYRIGYGGGYYDQALSKRDGKGLSVGLAYDFQILDEIPRDKGDRRVDIVVTESKIIFCQRRSV